MKMDVNKFIKTETLIKIGGTLMFFLLVKNFFGNLFPAINKGKTGIDDLPVTPAPDNSAPATLTISDANIISSNIEHAIYGSGIFESWTENEQAVIDNMKKVQNSSDLKLLINTYGVRGSILNKKNLLDTIVEYLSPSDIAEINNDYAMKGISITV